MTGRPRLAVVGSGAPPTSQARRTHLRVGEGRLEGPACGNDLRVTARGQRTGISCNLTDDPSQVTCRVCRRSYPFQTRAAALRAEKRDEREGETP